MLAFATFALRYPRLFKFLRRFGKWIAIAAAVAFVVTIIAHKKNQWEVEHYNQGFRAAADQYQARVDAANKIAANDQAQMNLMVASFGGLAQQRVQDITLKVEPKIERIRDEVATNRMYRDCAVGDGVLEQINSARDTVNAGIAASNSQPD